MVLLRHKSLMHLVRPPLRNRWNPQDSGEVVYFSYALHFSVSIILPHTIMSISLIINGVLYSLSSLDFTLIGLYMMYLGISRMVESM